MKRTWLGVAALVLVGGCRSVGLPALRTNFPGESRLEAQCVEYKSDPDIVAEAVAAQYQSGWRMAYISESATSFLGFSTPHVRICYERLLSGAVRKQQPPSGADDLAKPAQREAPKHESPPAVIITEEVSAGVKAQVEQAIAAKQSLLASCRRAYGKDVSTVKAKVTVETSGELQTPRVEAPTSNLANCVERVLKTLTIAQAAPASVAVELEIPLSK